MDKPREYFIKIAPFEYYGACFFAARDRLNANGSPNLNYFKDTPDVETEHTFDEARENLAFIRKAYPGRKTAVLHKTELKSHSFEEAPQKPFLFNL